MGWFRDLGSVVLLVAAASVSAADLGGTVSVTNLELISSTRVGRTTYDYVYRVVLTNAGDPVSNVLVTGSGGAQGLTFIDNSASAATVGGGGAALTGDTITIRQDRRFPFSLAAINWMIAGTQLTGPTSAGCLDPRLDTPGTVTIENQRQIRGGATYQETRIDRTITGPTVFQGNTTNVQNVVLTFVTGPNAGLSSGPAEIYTIHQGMDGFVFGSYGPALIPATATYVLTYSPPRRFPFGLAINQSFTQSYIETMVVEGGQPYSRTITSTLTFLGFETVTVPAGTFTDACKVQEVSTYSDAPGLTLTDTRWHAQGVGVVPRSVTGDQETVLLPGSSINGVPIVGTP